jgi:hypothetical protein
LVDRDVLGGQRRVLAKTGAQLNEEGQRKVDSDGEWVKSRSIEERRRKGRKTKTASNRRNDESACHTTRGQRKGVLSGKWKVESGKWKEERGKKCKGVKSVKSVESVEV